MTLHFEIDLEKSNKPPFTGSIDTMEGLLFAVKDLSEQANGKVTCLYSHSESRMHGRHRIIFDRGEEVKENLCQAFPHALGTCAHNQSMGDCGPNCSILKDSDCPMPDEIKALALEAEQDGK